MFCVHDAVYIKSNQEKVLLDNWIPSVLAKCFNCTIDVLHVFKVKLECDSCLPTFIDLTQGTGI